MHGVQPTANASPSRKPPTGPLAGIAIGPFLTFFSSFRKHMGTVEKIVGVLLILTGLLFLTGQFGRLSYWFLETFPILQNFG